MGAFRTDRNANTIAGMRVDSCHSSYDNLDMMPNDFDDYDRYIDNPQQGQGVDPTELAAQLAGIQKGRFTPPAMSPTSSQPDMFVTPCMSSPCVSLPSEPQSPSQEMPPDHEKAPGVSCHM